ncbi:MAG: hypothetical protein LC631_06815 [Desulfovibrionales bacterium]|nr:hypothetical protein [Desulfovibrionales bacterium]
MIFSPTVKGRRNATLRLLMLVILFVGIGYLFWKNYERSMETIQTRHVVQDETQTLNREIVQEIVAFSTSLQQRFGMSLQVKIFEGFVITPRKDSKVIFIGLSPRYKEASIKFPPLMRSALPEGFVTYIKEDHFDEFWVNGNWQQGLIQALNKIGEEIIKIEKGE